MNRIKGKTVRNIVTGETGVIVGRWLNQSGQTVLNVRVNGMAASWNARRIGKVA